MKKIILLILISNCTSLLSQSQFQLSIGGLYNDYGHFIVQTPDGGYAVAGSGTIGSAYTDLYVVKLSANGTIQWSRTAGVTYSDYANCIIRTTDGGYVVGGYEYLGTGSTDPFLMKLNGAGTLEWTRTARGFDNNQITSVIQTTDGGYAFAGLKSGQSTGTDMLIVKLDNNANLQWSRIVGDTAYEAASSIVQTADGGYAVTGITYSFEGNPYSNIYIIKLNGLGNLLWSRTIGGALNDEASCLIQAADGGLVMAGRTQSFGAGSSDMYIVKLSSSGTIQWTRTVGLATEEQAYSIIQTSDGGYAVAGFILAGNFDIYIIKLNSSGVLQWSRKIGGTSHEEAYCIIQTSVGGYAVAGHTSSFGAGNTDMYIVKLDSNGNTCGNTVFPSSLSGTGGVLNSTVSTVNIPTLTVVAESPTSYSGGSVTTICFVGIEPISNNIPVSHKLHQNYPNPFNPSTKIKFDIPPLSFGEGPGVRLVIYDILSREIAILVNEHLQPGTYEVEWDGTNYPSGVHFYKLTTADYTETRKMVLMK